MRTNLHVKAAGAFPYVSAQPWMMAEPVLPRLVRQAALPAPAPEPRTLGAVRRLLVGMRGSGSAASAVRVAAELAHRHGARAEVLSVYEPRIPYPPLADELPPRLEPADQPAADAQLACVRRLLADAAQDDAAVAAWPVELEVGQAAARLAHVARQRHADLIVLGRGGTDGRESWLRNRTALRVAVVATTPVLAVADGARMPRRLLLAVGLDELTLHVARAVRQLFPDLEAVDLVHVRLDGNTSDAELDAQFARIALVLGYPAERVTRAVLGGDPVHAILDHATRTAPDCIASGLHGVTVAERSLARNLSLHLLDEAETSVLVVPK